MRRLKDIFTTFIKLIRSSQETIKKCSKVTIASSVYLNESKNLRMPSHFAFLNRNVPVHFTTLLKARRYKNYFWFVIIVATVSYFVVLILCTHYDNLYYDYLTCILFAYFVYNAFVFFKPLCPSIDLSNNISKLNDQCLLRPLPALHVYCLHLYVNFLNSKRTLQTSRFSVKFLYMGRLICQ